ncbi:MAG: cbb3-type cytochrome c oxidase subunit 3 [Pikeienuella sp.]
METYTFLREFADSWMLLAMTTFFLGVIAWVFRPGAKQVHAAAAQIPLTDGVSTKTSECNGTCAGCAGKTNFEELRS